MHFTVRCAVRIIVAGRVFNNSTQPGRDQWIYCEQLVMLPYVCVHFLHHMCCGCGIFESVKIFIYHSNTAVAVMKRRLQQKIWRIFVGFRLEFFYVPACTKCFCLNFCWVLARNSKEDYLPLPCCTASVSKRVKKNKERQVIKECDIRKKF